MPKLSLYSPPATEPVTLAEAKVQLRIEDSDATVPQNMYAETPNETPNSVLKVFTVDYAVTAGTHPLVFIDSDFQTEGVDYTFSGVTFTFTDAPATGSAIRIWYKSDLVTTTSEDTFIETLVKAAREWCERFQNRSYITQTWRLYLDDFPDDDYIELPKPPLVTVSSVTYYDTANALQTLAVAQYVVDAIDEPGTISLAYGCSWPSTYAQRNVVIVEYVAGYGAASAVSLRVKQAILMLVSHWYENREPVFPAMGGEMDLGVKALLWQDRVNII